MSSRWMRSIEISSISRLRRDRDAGVATTRATATLSVAATTATAALSVAATECGSGSDFLSAGSACDEFDEAMRHCVGGIVLSGPVHSGAGNIAEVVPARQHGFGQTFRILECDGD